MKIWIKFTRFTSKKLSHTKETSNFRYISHIFFWNLSPFPYVFSVRYAVKFRFFCQARRYTSRWRA